jgi:L-lactate dehydrogenase complex protein LldG
MAEAAAAIRGLPAAQSARQIVSLVPEVLPGTVASTRWTIRTRSREWTWRWSRGVRGGGERRGVADRRGSEQRRAVLFVTQHLVLVVPGKELVHTLHDAYARLRLGCRGLRALHRRTVEDADIEQALVIGAHGARSATIVLSDEADEEWTAGGLRGNRGGVHPSLAGVAGLRGVAGAWIIPDRRIETALRRR